jgi:hypothetical protein
VSALKIFFLAIGYLVPTLSLVLMRWVACCFMLANASLLGCAPLGSLTEKVAIGFSMLRLPVTLRTPEVNTCIEPAQLSSLEQVSEALDRQQPRPEAIAQHFVREVEEHQCRRVLLRHPVADRVDDHADLVDAQTIVIVAISGGGARAARLGAHTLAQLEERYNAYSEAGDHGELRPLACQIAAYSTVSGGSIYVSYVASRYASGTDNVGEGCRNPSEDEEVRTVFQGARDRVRAQVGQRDLGALGASAYLSPTSLFLLPLMTLVTDRSFLDVLSHGVNMTQEHYFSETMLGELPQRPRFFFNSVSIETGTPFVLTQRIQQLPSDFRPSWTARIDVPRLAQRDPARPLSVSLMLEDLNSSPALFPLSYAAMASAAFPPVMEPLEIREYGFDSETGKMFSTERTVHLTDGGVFDNSGLITAVDFFEYLVHEARQRAGGTPVKRSLLLLSINAETSRAQGHRRTSALSAESSWNIGVNWPIRHLGAGAIDQVHFTNKRRGEEIAWERLETLKRALAPDAEVDVLYFPVNLTQLSELDPFAIEDGEEMFNKVSRIPTDYVIRVDHDKLLARAVEQILDADQSSEGRHPGTGWPVGPRGSEIHQLGDAFVRAIAFAEAGR